MNLFKAAQNALLSSQPETYRLDEPPSPGWWVAKFQVSLSGAALLRHFQARLLCNTVEHEGVHWEVGGAGW